MLKLSIMILTFTLILFHYEIIIWRLNAAFGYEKTSLYYCSRGSQLSESQSPIKWKKARPARSSNSGRSSESTAVWPVKSHQMSIKSCPKMISLEKIKILTPLQKLPIMWEIWEINCCQRLWKFAQSPINHPIWSHWSTETLARTDNNKDGHRIDRNGQGCTWGLRDVYMVDISRQTWTR